MAIKKISKETQSTIALLKANGASPTKISKQTGIHHATVKKVLAEPAIIDQVADMEQELAATFQELAMRTLKSISESDLERASLQQKAVSAGIFLDKNRLITGKSTQNTAVMLASCVLEAERISNEQAARDREA